MAACAMATCAAPCLTVPSARRPTRIQQHSSSACGGKGRWAVGPSSAHLHQGHQGGGGVAAQASFSRELPEVETPDDIQRYRDGELRMLDPASGGDANLKPMFAPVGVADDYTIANPLERMDRLGTKWFCAVFQLEGVIFKRWGEEESIEAWKRLADEQEKEIPYEWQIKKAMGMPVNLAISQVFCWERDPMAVRRIEQRHKELLVEQLGEDFTPETRPDAEGFLKLMQNYDVPCAVVSADLGTEELKSQLEKAGLLEYFKRDVKENPPLTEPKEEPEPYLEYDSTRAVEDDYRGDDDGGVPEFEEQVPRGRVPQLVYYMASDEYATVGQRDAADLGEAFSFGTAYSGRTCERTIVFTSDVEGISLAKDYRMKTIALTGDRPRHEFNGADIPITSLAEVQFERLKRLFSVEESDIAEPEMEQEVEVMPKQNTSVATAPVYWEDDVGPDTQADAPKGPGGRDQYKTGTGGNDDDDDDYGWDSNY